jgi:hypothetical protein
MNRNTDADYDSATREPMDKRTPVGRRACGAKGPKVPEDSMKNFELKLVAPKAGVALVIESDEQCCYAYYLSGGRVTGFVWLYNLGHLSDSLERKGDHGVCNPKKFCKVPPIAVGQVPEDFQSIWQERNGVLECAIYVCEKLTAVVGDGDQPGWCRNATVDGPFAFAL